MLKELIKKLYLRYCTPDLAALTLHQLGYFQAPVTPENDPEFYLDARDLTENKTNNYILNEVVEQLKDSLLHRTDPENIIYDRFSLNGIYLYKEKLEKYAELVDDKEEDFDKHELL